MSGQVHILLPLFCQQIIWTVQTLMMELYTTNVKQKQKVYFTVTVCINLAFYSFLLLLLDA